MEYFLSSICWLPVVATLLTSFEWKAENKESENREKCKGILKAYRKWYVISVYKNQ
jgi:uncharacterized membrane protein